MAVFEVVRYLQYEKPGEYGDPRGEEFRFLVQDSMRNPKVPQGIADRVATLQKGDRVRLTWRHEYVTRTEGAGSSSFPERPVVLIEKLSPQAADELLGKAEHGREP